MQNLGENKIVAMIRHEDRHVEAYPTGMVVFFKRTVYDSDGYNVSGDIEPTPVAEVHSYTDQPVGTVHQMRTESRKYMVAGVTLVDRVNMGLRTHGRATVHVGGSVTFCNTGPIAISAGEEVWARISGDIEKAPETVPRGRDESATGLEDDGYQFVGLCVLGCDASNFSIRRHSFGQMLLGRRM